VDSFCNTDPSWDELFQLSYSYKTEEKNILQMLINTDT